MHRPVTVAIMGAGSRGRTFANYVERFPDQVQLVAVADPRTDRRDAIADRHSVPGRSRFDDWRDAASDRAHLADAVLILTPDAEHAEAAKLFARRGYHILLEKPMAGRESDCVELVEAIEDSGVVLAVCHVMRYTPYTAAVSGVLDSGRLGELVGIDHLESVGWWHFAHSYVRGNWRRSDLAGPSILTKCCHDLDWLRYLVSRPPTRVSSTGGLHHFTAANRPPRAADGCLDCAVEPDCPYSAPRLYLGCLGDPASEKWPLGVVTTDASEPGVLAALRAGPYGRCVYACDNDVADHQVVRIDFAGGVTATLTMSAFTPVHRRRTRIMGTRGFLDGDGEILSVTDFVTGVVDRVRADVTGGHDGGNDGLMRAFVHAVSTGDRSLILSTPREALDSHLMAFAAERSRKADGQVISLLGASK
jgi:predicted dehydrogenase